MSVYRAPLTSLRFLLNEVLDAPVALTAAGWEDASADLFDEILQQAARVAEEVLFPLNAKGDQEGAAVSNGGVRLPAGFAEAHRLWRDGGWNALAGDPAYGGQGMPAVLDGLVTEMVSAANLAFGIIPGLTQGAIRAIAAHAEPALKDWVLPPMISGEWTGAMALTEPHAGTDLGLLRTRAVPDGVDALGQRHRLHGQKMFISVADQDITDNLVHLVLARLPGAPGGTRGISLFLVPKILPDGSRNGWVVTSTEHKMGLHASPTCVVSYEGAIGWQIGAANRGLAAMFTMMNHERLFVGIEGIGVGECATQSALAHARDREQGRAPGAPANPDRPADPLTALPDIRRMLLSSRTLTDAGRALTAWTALRMDLAAKSADEQTRNEAEGWAALLTPIIKASGTDFGFDAAVMAQQVMGGHGYIRDNGVEQLVRDVRVTQIYEGANGVQALDLVQRKLTLNDGRPLAAFLATVREAADELGRQSATADLSAPLHDATDTLAALCQWLTGSQGDGQATDPLTLAAGATDLLRLFTLVAYGWMWALMATAAARKPDGYTDSYLAARIGLARYFITRHLSDVTALDARVRQGHAALYGDGLGLMMDGLDAG